MKRGEEDPMIEKIYQARFDSATIAAKKELWEVLVEDFLQDHVPTGAVVADIGGGYCEFINAVRCRQKFVVDLNPDVERYADPDVEILMSDASDIRGLADASVDVVFASNFFEHLPTKGVLFEVLAEMRRILKSGGKLLVIQPNIKYAYREYWDFIDHHIALTESSLGEALTISGFEIERCIPRFLPFSVNSSPSRSSRLLKLYLRLPPIWRIFGKQTFMVGVKP
jgi:ubiquinone/menaquinone biosynthesis C-methylase UbiE